MSISTTHALDDGMASIKEAIEEQLDGIVDQLVNESVAKFTKDAEDKIRKRASEMIPSIAMYVFNTFEMTRMGHTLVIRCELKDPEN